LPGDRLLNTPDDCVVVPLSIEYCNGANPPSVLIVITPSLSPLQEICTKGMLAITGDGASVTTTCDVAVQPLPSVTTI